MVEPCLGFLGIPQSCKVHFNILHREGPGFPGGRSNILLLFFFYFFFYFLDRSLSGHSQEFLRIFIGAVTQFGHINQPFFLP